MLLVNTEWKRKTITLAVVLGMHLGLLLSLKMPSDSRTNATLTIEFVLASYRSGTALQASDPSAAQHLRRVSAKSNAEGAARDYGPFRYQNFEHLDTRAAPSLITWNIDKRFLHRGEPTTLVFTVWVSAAGTIDALEPHTINGEQWTYDGLAETLQTTSMVPASLRTQPVASTMTVELVVDDD
nr:hypothetical protein [uncultured Rhodoferax sp.]